MTIPNDMEKLFGTAEAAEYLGVSVSQMAQWRFNGRGPKYVALSPRKIRYTRAAIEEFVEASKRTHTGQRSA